MSGKRNRNALCPCGSGKKNKHCCAGKETGSGQSKFYLWIIGGIIIIGKVAGVLIILFGLHTIGVLPVKWLFYEKRFNVQKVRPGWIGSFVMGLAFAFGWTPCIGPILAGILALAATQETVAQGTFLLSVYSLGLGIPFILTGFGTQLFLQFFNRYKRFIRWGEIFAGALLIFVGNSALQKVASTIF